MSNAAIQQSLIELEQNLRNLTSAREQVENVANGTEQLISTVIKLVVTIEGLSGQFDPSEFSFEDKISDALKTFSKSINDGAAKAVKNYEELAEKNTGSFESAVKTLEQKLNESLKEFEKNINEGAEKATTKYQELSDKNSQAIESTVGKLDEFRIHLQKTEDQIKEFDLAKSHIEIKEKLDESFNESETRVAQLTSIVNSRFEELEKLIRFNRMLLIALTVTGISGLLIVITKLL